MKKYALIGENGRLEAKILEGVLLKGAEIKSGIDGASSNSITKIREYGNLEDIKNIHQNRFYHKLIDRIKKIDNSRIYFNKGKILPCTNNKETASINENKNSDKLDKFALIDNTYLWMNSDNITQDIGLISNITNEVYVLGYIVKELTINSPQIVKVLAIYIE